MISIDWDEDPNPTNGEVLWLDNDRAFHRVAFNNDAPPALIVVPSGRSVGRGYLKRLSREFQIRDQLDERWALLPVSFEPESGTLAYDDHLCRPLSAYMQTRLELPDFLRVAAAASRAVNGMHASGLIHKDIRPGNLLVGETFDDIRIIGFGIASRLPRERRSTMPPEVIEGTLQYMAPEQTGRMNRSVDARSDLYALGVTLYELLTGFLPFSASDPAEWIHCHVARHPTSPRQLSPDVPEAVGAILMKLMEKSAEARYQTARGLEHDLTRCLNELKSGNAIEEFELGSCDASSELAIPEGLYGRRREVQKLTATLDEMVACNSSRMLLVSGYSGIGKTSVVNELQRALVPLRGLFATGKFDQYKRDIPYAIFAQAFQGLVLQLLGKEEDELAGWRDNFLGALGSNGELMVNLIPELEAVIGKQPPVPALSGPEAHTRLMSVFQSFIEVFATKEHPLVLFLDDLQWLDLATLDLFTHVSTRLDLKHLMIVGAYRDNEVGSTHPLTRRLDLIRSAGRPIDEIRLTGISSNDVSTMLADLLETEPGRVESLSRVINSKAGGNPFFILQFIGAMADENLIYYDTTRSAWRWDIDRVSTKQISENVVDLMVERLSRLSLDSLQALKLAACMGSSIDVEQFHCVVGKGEREVQDLLKEALRMGLLIKVDATYAFAHDRVQEAAYAMLSEPERRSTHRQIASQLAVLYGDDVDEQLFNVVDQFNRAAIPEDEAKTRLLAASLNLRAGINAKSTSAYAAARGYLDHGLAYLNDQSWHGHYDLTFNLALQQAECTFMAGQLDEARTMVHHLLERAQTKVHLATVYRLKVELHLVQSDNFSAAQSGLAALRLFDIDFPEHPSQSHVEDELEALSNVLDGRPVSSFAQLPAMTSPEMLALMKILAEMWPPAFFTDFNLTTLIACRMVKISFQHGIAPSSNQGLAMLGWIMGPAFGRYDEGYQMVQLACDLAQQQKAPVDLARVYNTMSLTSSWTQSLSTSIEWYRTAFRVGVEAGDLFFACFPCAFIAMTLLQRGRDLHKEAPELVELRAATRRTGFRDGADMALVPERASACLRGLTANISDFSDADFDQGAFERDLGGARAPTVGWFYWTRKVMLHYLAGEFATAVSVLDKVVTGTCKIVQIEHLDYHFYGALACAAHIHEVGQGENGELRQRFNDFKDQLGKWIEQTRSPTFAGKHALVLAEAARLDGLDLEAQRLYEESIRLSLDNEFLQDEAVAYEAAARYYAARGLDKIGLLYLREARERFHKWGADAKVALLDKRLTTWANTIEGPALPRDVSPESLEQLDLATVIKVLEAVSNEIVLERLIDIVMKAAIEHAGAERAILLLDMGAADLRVMAEASTRLGALTISQAQHDVSSFDLARSVVLYVARTGEPVVLEDASAEGVGRDDPYVRDNLLRSVLCVPLTSQGSGVGLLYLENNLAPGAFTPSRLALLKILASQAAASLEKARLIRDLEERQSRIRRLVDSNIIGIVIWGRDGRLLDANDAFLQMTQYTREDLERGLAWYDMTPPDWQTQVTGSLSELTATGVMQPREKEYFRRDGSRVRVLIGAAAFDAQASEGVAYILDLTEREIAERKAVESEQRFRDLQAELAHANRIETVGQLSTWIAHDIRQPLVGMVASANAGFQWLSATPPNVGAAQRSLQRVEEEGHRAAAILDKIRALMKKGAPVRERVDLNDLVLSTLPLLQSEAGHKAINVQVDLAQATPLVAADRIQLQQVIMNMVVNAIDAMSASGENEKKLTIATRVDDKGEVTTSVNDTGPPLPPEEYDRFFEAFYSTKQHGLGIGLGICKNIVESYGGRIWGEPCAPHGTSVRFCLPGYTSTSGAGK